MKRFFTVYSLTDCQFCKKAINLLDNNNLPFVVVVVDKNPEFLQKIKQDTNHPTVPIVIEHIENQNRIIGGSDNLENYLNSSEFKND
jgi:glutaredoxin